MPLTAFQRRVCRLLADRRRASGESYVAGGVALSVAIETARISRDIDVFHDTTDAVGRAWDADRTTLVSEGFDVTTLREVPGFIEAAVTDAREQLIMEWARDSAFRFFPLVEHDELGLTLHPFDLATNKVLALVGRLEVRDWIDVLACHEQVQPLGYLAWAACGKDPGFTPHAVLDHAARSARYSQEEVSALAFEGPAPDAGQLSRRWHAALASARTILDRLPATSAGEAVLDRAGGLFTGQAAGLSAALEARQLFFHAGRLRGSLPQVRGRPSSAV